jgi:hypothetical protein
VIHPPCPSLSLSPTSTPTHTPTHACITGFLNAYFPRWFQGPPQARLPFAYNAQRTLFWMTHEKTPGYWDAVQPVRVRAVVGLLVVLVLVCALISAQQDAAGPNMPFYFLAPPPLCS